MSEIIRFTITDDEHEMLTRAMRPVPVIMIGGYTPSSPQENANAAWRQLGKTYGVEWESIRPFGLEPIPYEFTGEKSPPPLGHAITFRFATEPDSPDMRFVEVEYDDGRGLKLGTWIDGEPYGGIRITAEDFAEALAKEANR